MRTPTMTTPAEINAARAETEKQKTMAGCTLPSFRCAKCGQPRIALGHKPMVKGYPKAGYACRECVTGAPCHA